MTHGYGDQISAIRTMIFAIGDDPDRADLVETPERVIKAWKEMFSGYRHNGDDDLKWFDSECDAMVVVKGIAFQSTCEHHLLPFFGEANVAYLPQGRIIGLSKLPRLVTAKSRRLQVQERLTMEIGKAVEAGGVRGVGVSLTGRHLCTMARGARQPEAEMVTNYISGLIKTDAAARAEFFSAIR